MSKIIFVGQQPNSHEDEGNPLPIRPGTSGQRIVQMMGVTSEAFEQSFVRMNVSPFHDPDEFSPSYWKTSIDNILPLFYGRRVVLLGPAVASAFGLARDDYSWAHWFDHPKEHMLVSVIPHPSGLNRLYNNPEIYEMVKSFLDECWRQRNV